MAYTERDLAGQLTEWCLQTSEEAGEGMPRQVRFEWELPDEVFDDRFREEDLLRSLKEDAVVRLFSEGRVSSGAGAALLDISRRAFLELLYRRGVPYFKYSPEELQRELEAVERLGSERETRGEMPG